MADAAKNERPSAPFRSAKSRPATAEDLYLILLTVASCGVRLWFAFWVHIPRLYVFSDMEIYWHRAASLASGTLTQETAFTPLGYPAFLALSTTLFGAERYTGAAAVQALLSGLVPLLVHLIVKKVASRAAATLASSMAALHVPLVVYTGYFLTESLFSFFICLFAWLCAKHAADPRRWVAIAAGASFAYAAALRPSALLFLVLAVPWVLRNKGTSRPLRAPILTAAGLTFVLCLGVTMAVGRPTAIATNGGVNLYLSVCECGGVVFTKGREVRAVTAAFNFRHYKGMVTFDRAAEDSSFFTGEALSLVARDPARLLHSGSHLVDGLGLGHTGAFPDQPYWPGLPGSDTLMGVYGRLPFVFGWAPALVLMVVARVRRIPLGTAGALLGLLLGSVLLALLFFAGDPRVRVSMDPIALAAAATFLDALAGPRILLAARGLSRAVAARLARR